MTDDFLAATLDVWSIPPESARRVGHPAPFPVELPEQLIRLYTFRGDLVLDPFMGSGSALVAAARLARRYIGYDLDADYVEIARRRVAEATAAVSAEVEAECQGRAAHDLAADVVERCGFRITARDKALRGTGVAIDLVATDAGGKTWFFDVPGPFTSHRRGLQRADAVWKALGRACAVRGARGEIPLVLLASALPRRRSGTDAALRAAGPTAFFDAIDLLSDDDLGRLRRYAADGPAAGPQPGFWSAADLAR